MAASFFTRRPRKMQPIYATLEKVVAFYQPQNRLRDE